MDLCNKRSAWTAACVLLTQSRYQTVRRMTHIWCVKLCCRHQGPNLKADNVGPLMPSQTVFHYYWLENLRWFPSRGGPRRGCRTISCKPNLLSECNHPGPEKQRTEKTNALDSLKKKRFMVRTKHLKASDTFHGLYCLSLAFRSQTFITRSPGLVMNACDLNTKFSHQKSTETNKLSCDEQKSSSPSMQKNMHWYCNRAILQPR